MFTAALRIKKTVGEGGDVCATRTFFISLLRFGICDLQMLVSHLNRAVEVHNKLRGHIHTNQKETHTCAVICCCAILRGNGRNTVLVMTNRGADRLNCA